MLDCLKIIKIILVFSYILIQIKDFILFKSKIHCDNFLINRIISLKLGEFTEFLIHHEKDAAQIEEVVFVCFDDENYALYQQQLDFML